MRRSGLGLGILLMASSLRGEKVTLPAASSLVGMVPFFSDVRVFNTSYTSSLDVTASYHCYVSSPCTPGVAQVEISLAPRQSRSYDDIIARTFLSPNTAGGIEFDFSGSEDQLVVTSRLYSTSPTPTVGMLVAGVSSSKAYTTSALTSIKNGGSVKGFRTNAGFYNANDASATVTFQIFDAGAAVGDAQSQTIPGHSGFQINAIFTAANAASLVTEDAVIVASASVPVFSYAAVIDNNTTDPIFVAGAPDQPLQAVMPTTHTVHVGRGGTNFVDDVSGTNVTTINVGDTVLWVWEGDLHHGTDAGTCTGGGGGYNPYGNVHPQGYGGGGGGGSCTSANTFKSGILIAPASSPWTFTQAGTFPYFCDVHMNAMTGRIVVNPSP